MDDSLTKSFPCTKKCNNEFLLQWHITNKCENNCAHCYMSPEQRNDKNALTTKDCYRVIDDLVDFTNDVCVTPRICFTGGDPLLREDFWQVLGYARQKKVISHILGNPDQLDDKTIDRLKECGVSRYQLSFDGLRDTHDSLRGKGSFNTSLSAVERLTCKGIQVVVMSTVTKQNQYELAVLARQVISKGAKRFDFARLVPIGNGRDLAGLCFEPLEYRAFLERMYREYKKMISDGIPERFLGTKDPLWSLLLYEKKELVLPQNNLVYSGCSVAKSGFCMDADGTLYACRRMPVGIGNIKHTSIREFFINLPEMNRYREFEKIEGCGSCQLMPVCRGCRAVAWSKTGSYFGRDPQCWKLV